MSTPAMGRLPHTDRHGEVLFDAVREGLWPFKADGIYIYLEYDIDYHRYRVLVEVRFKGNWHIAHSEYVDAWKLADDPDGEVWKLCPKFVHAFRNREDYFDLAPLIHLGEQ